MTCIVFSRFDGGYCSDCFLSIVTPLVRTSVYHFIKIGSAILELYYSVSRRNGSSYI